MKMKNLARIILLLGIGILFFFPINIVQAQLDANTCPLSVKRNNGNGQYATGPGTFTYPNYSINNPVATNVIGTVYQYVPYDPVTKTGTLIIYWNSSTVISKVPVITRVWITASGISSLSTVKFGPPSPPVGVGNNYNVTYHFYGMNIPPQGTLTLEFTDPQTKQPAYYCSFDLQSGGSVSTPSSLASTYCSPTIVSQPVNQTICGSSAATFSVVATGVSSYKWQVNTGSSWSDITGSGDYSNYTTTALTVSNPTNKNGYQYRAVLTSSCGSVTSDAVQLISRPSPTATFSNGYSCGTGAQNIIINLTGTAPWTISVKTGSDTTIYSAIYSSPFSFAVNPGMEKDYEIVSVTDAYCTNTYSASSNVKHITLPPTITLSSSSASGCNGTGSFQIAYTTTSGNPDKYSISSGARALGNFVAINNETLPASPINVIIPSDANAGTYDFVLVIKNNTSGCVSQAYPITLNVYSKPNVTASALRSGVCISDTVTVIAAPQNLTSYIWTSTAASGTQASAVSYVPSVNVATTFTVEGTDAHGCKDTGMVRISPMAGPTLSISPSSATICNGSAVQLSVSGGNTYSWSPSTGLSATSGDIVVASPSSSTTYTVRSQNITGCSSTGDVAVTVISPNITVTSNSNICAGASQGLTASGGSTYTWYPSTGLSATTGTSVTATPTATSTYYVVGTDANSCTGIASSTVTITSAPIDPSSTPNEVVFCVTSLSMTLNVIMNQTINSPTWYYSTNGTSYTLVNSTLPTGLTGCTSSTSGTNPTLNCKLALTWSNGNYTGPIYYKLTFTSGNCTYSYVIHTTDTKSTTAPSPTATKTTICLGNSTTLTIGSLVGSNTVSWESSTNNTSWTSLGMTTAAITVSPSVNTYYHAVFNGGNGNCGSTSTSLLITVTNAADTNKITPSLTCSDGSSSIFLDGSAISGGIYQWQRSTTGSSANFADILGATTEDYTLPYNIVPSTYLFRRIATAGNCSSTTSAYQNIYAPISNNQITTSYTMYCNSASSMTINASSPVGGNGSYTYQWQYSSDGNTWTDITGATSQNLTTTIQSASKYYRRYVVSGSCSDYSSNVLIDVKPNPTINASAASSPICNGSSTVLTASGGDHYTWNSDASLSNIYGPTTIATPSTNTTYTVRGYNEFGCYSDVNISVGVTSLPATPVLSSSALTLCSGDSVNLNSYVSSPASSYYWFSAPEANSLASVNSPTGVSAAGIYYVFAKTGNCFSSSYKSFTLTVDNVNHPVVSTTSITKCSPATVDLTTLEPAVVSGLTYEWHTVSSNPTSGDKVALPSAVSVSGTYYLFSKSNTGTCFGTASDGVVVSINSTPAKPSITVSTESTCSPGTVNLTDNYTTDGSSNYFWYKTSVATSNLINFPAVVSESGSYYLVAKSSNGCIGTTSDAVVVTINTLPEISIGSNQLKCTGDGTTITATATNTSSPAYQWQSSSDNVNWRNLTIDSTSYSGTSGSVLSIKKVDDLNGIYYRCKVTNSSGCYAVSSSTILIVETTATISTNPTSVTTIKGSTVTYSVATSGSTSLVYQWYKRGTQSAKSSDILLTEGMDSLYYGVHSDTLIIKNADIALNGDKYYVEITNTCTTCQSDAATLIVTESVLPIQLLSFEVRNKDGNAEIEWITADEYENDYFILQHAGADGVFSEITKVTAKNLRNTISLYAYTHLQPGIGIHYYRLVQVDFDGKQKTFSPKSIYISENRIVSVTPNPGHEYLQFDNLDELGTQKIYLLDLAGKTVREWKSENNSNLRVSLEGINSGYYVLRIMDGKMEKNIKIIIE